MERAAHDSLPLSIVLMGKIASGKGTQAARITDEFGGTIYSNGNKLRATIKEDTAFGTRLNDMYQNGYLMPEWIATYWMTHALLAEHIHDRVVFEAVAKKPNEAALFHEIHEWLGRSYIVLHIAVSDDVVRERSAARNRDSVDSPKSVEKRLEEYDTYTQRSIDYFRTCGTLIDIDGTGDEEVVYERVRAALQP